MGSESKMKCFTRPTRVGISGISVTPQSGRRGGGYKSKCIYYHTHLLSGNGIYILAGSASR